MVTSLDWELLGVDERQSNVRVRLRAMPLGLRSGSYECS